MSRKIEDLTPVMQTKYTLFKGKMDADGIDFIITCTYRSQEEQDKLWAQGRTEQGRVVTWTKNSRHTKRDAFDIAIMKNGKITWDAKDYQQAGVIGEACGLVWGGRWGIPDFPHFQDS